MAAWPPQAVMKRRRHLRNSSQDKFIELLPNTETYKNSYFCRTVKDWNALPSKTLSPQIVSKKSYLSILVNDEFKYCIMIDALEFFIHFNFRRNFLTSLFLILFHFI